MTNYKKLCLFIAKDKLVSPRIKRDGIVCIHMVWIKYPVRLLSLVAKMQFQLHSVEKFRLF